MKQQPKRILISRTDAIGDVILTLPVATILHQAFPDAHIGFLGRSYTKPVIECCSAVDEFIEEADFLATNGEVLRKSWDTIIHVFPKSIIAWKAFYAGIKHRIGTSSRPYHWATCNKLVRLNRRNSLLHEAQLNVLLLSPFGISEKYSAIELGKLFSLDNIPALDPGFATLADLGKHHIILHPKSAGSAREWGLDHFAALAKSLLQKNFQVFISGTEADKASLAPLFESLQGYNVVDICGALSLSQFIAFINFCDGLVAASTGPLHIASALSKVAIGLYPRIRPMHAGRWGPISVNSEAISLPGECSDCRKKLSACRCLQAISVEEVMIAIDRKLNPHFP